MLKVLDLIAITKWHTDWEFKLFFYIYRKYSISIFYMHITKGNSKINKSPSLPNELSLVTRTNKEAASMC